MDPPVLATTMPTEAQVRMWAQEQLKDSRLLQLPRELACLVTMYASDAAIVNHKASLREIAKETFYNMMEIETGNCEFCDKEMIFSGKLCEYVGVDINPCDNCNRLGCEKCYSKCNDCWKSYCSDCSPVFITCDTCSRIWCQKCFEDNNDACFACDPDAQPDI